MAAFSPLSPGLQLMRRMRWPGKVAWGTVLALLAVVLAGLSAPYWLTAIACALMLYVQLALWVSMAQDMEAVAGSMRKTTQGDLTAYAFARTGYHRGLDQLRRNGWKGFGPVPYRHEPNRGFLRCVAALARAADTIGETDEYARCLDLLDDCDPSARAELGLS